MKKTNDNEKMRWRNMITHKIYQDILSSRVKNAGAHNFFFYQITQQIKQIARIIMK